MRVYVAANQARPCASVSTDALKNELERASHRDCLQVV